MVQTMSSRGQCCIYCTDAALVLTLSVFFLITDLNANNNISVQLRDYSCKLQKVFEMVLITLCCFLKEMSCHDYTTVALEIMMKPYCNPVKHSYSHFQKWQLVWHGVTCHSKRHSVLCASEQLIIYGFISMCCVGYRLLLRLFLF